MVTTDDIATLIFAQLNATPGFSAAVPGKTYYDRAPTQEDLTAYPYAVFTVKSSDPALCFDSFYSQAFQVGIAAYCPPRAVTGVTTSTVKQFFWAALAVEAANDALMATALRNPTEHVMHSIPLPETGEFQPTLREGRDIFVCGLTVELMIQGDRSVP